MLNQSGLPLPPMTSSCSTPSWVSPITAPMPFEKAISRTSVSERPRYITGTRSIVALPWCRMFGAAETEPRSGPRTMLPWSGNGTAQPIPPPGVKR